MKRKKIFLMLMLFIIFNITFMFGCTSQKIDVNTASRTLQSFMDQYCAKNKDIKELKIVSIKPIRSSSKLLLVEFSSQYIRNGKTVTVGEATAIFIRPPERLPDERLVLTVVVNLLGENQVFYPMMLVE